MDGLGLEERRGGVKRELPAGWAEEPTAQNMASDLRGLRHFRSRGRCKHDTAVPGAGAGPGGGGIECPGLMAAAAIVSLSNSWLWVIYCF